MKAGWELKKFGEVLEIRNGKNQREVESEDGAYPIFGSAGNVMGYASAYICEAGATIIGRKGNINTPVYSETRFWNVDTAFGLVAKSSLDCKFLYYFCLSFDFGALNRGTTIPSLVKSELLEISMPLPPLPEQQRIVAILDEAFDGIATAKANAEKNLQNARALFESHLQAVFTERGEGWVEAPLFELCDIKHGYAFEGEFFRSAGDYVLLTPGNFYEKGGYRDRGEKQKYYIGEIPRDYVLKKGDLLVAMTEQSAGLLGSPILVPESDKFLHNQRLGLVIKKPRVSWTNEFFFHVFNTQAVRKEIHRTASGVKVRHTSPTKIGQVVVAFPGSTTEQGRIVAMLDSLATETQRLESLYLEKLAALDELKQSLLHQAFSGQL